MNKLTDLLAKVVSLHPCAF